MIEGGLPVYGHLTNEQLLAEIATFRDAIRQGMLGGGVSRVSGEGRSVTILGANIDGLRDALRGMEAEAGVRGLVAGGGGSIAVEIG